MTSIKFMDHLLNDIEEKIWKDLIDYETRHGIDVNYKRFSLVLFDECEEAIGVLNGLTACAEIYIDDMWVDTSHRGRGYGKTLVKELEDHFKGKGFNNINLVTSQFQAPEFYKKCGFMPEFVRKNLSL